MATTRAHLDNNDRQVPKIDIWEVMDQCNQGTWTDSGSHLQQFNERVRIPVDELPLRDMTMHLSETWTQLQYVRIHVGNDNQQAQDALTKLDIDITFVRNLLLAVVHDGKNKKDSLGYSHTDVFQEKRSAEVDS